jgi:hypothetical protein
MIGLLLEDWKEAAWLLAIAIIVGFVLWYRHELLEEGIGRQRATDKVAYDAQLKQANLLTAAAQATADLARGNYATEITSSDRYRLDHPVGAVSLCDAAPSPGAGTVSQARGGLAGNAVGRAGAGPVLAVPAGGTAVESQRSRDIGPLLNLLAGRADQVSAQLREFQDRGH